MQQEPASKASSRHLIIGSAAAALIGAAVASPAALSHEGATDEAADPGIGEQATETFLIRRGGRLYDNWAAELGIDAPEQTHAAYPADGKKNGADTWRCKECHGWDYMGKDGAYGAGSHYTGIKGIQALIGTNPEAIEEIITDDTHGYTDEQLPHEARDALARFIAWGQVTADDYIDRETGRARGDPRHGAEIFQTVCSVCHGLDGKAMNFSDEDKPEFIGTVANENPWETLHKIRFGHAGAPMVALIAFPVKDQVDVLRYAQTLPAE